MGESVKATSSGQRLGKCRCCLSQYSVVATLKELTGVHYWFGSKEVYSEMLLDCFGFVLSHLDSPQQQMICDSCIHRLRDAADFKKLVLASEEQFLKEYPLQENSKMKTELKSEYDDSNVDAMDFCDVDHYDSDDNVKHKKIEEIKLQENVSIDSDIEDMPLSKMKNKKRKVTQQNNVAKPAKITKVEIKNTCLKKPIEISKIQQKTQSFLNAKKSIRKVVKKPSVMMKSSISIYSAEEKSAVMARAQQLIRERDTEYMTETNMSTIIDNSYICPFKCRHNEYICFYCALPISDPVELRQHTKTVHNPSNLKKFIRSKGLIKIDITEINCRLCSEKIDSLAIFKEHIVKVHSKKLYSVCPDGLLPFKLEKDNLKCCLCDKTFKYFHILNQHMNVHFSNHVCEVCGLGFVEKARLHMHRSNQHEVGSFPCEVCGKEFKTNYYRKLHVDRVHEKKGKVFCPLCDERLMSYHQKLKHMVEVHHEKPMSFPCDQCEKVCTSRRQLTVHNRRDHLKDFRNECHVCGMKFFTKFSLNNHMPTHTLERNYKCTVCEKSYPRVKTLREHMRIHNNDRRYVCGVCGLAFIQNCSLKGHMKSQHADYGSSLPEVS